MAAWALETARGCPGCGPCRRALSPCLVSISLTLYNHKLRNREALSQQANVLLLTQGHV